jgi:hypothetical protein
VITCLFIATFLLLTASAHAHGDHKDKPLVTEPAPSPTENIYSAEGEAPASPDTDLPLSRMDIVVDDPNHKMEMGKGHDAHAGHKMPDVKISTHTWVSTSQKGYGVAVGITVFAGLVFGALSLIRPNE